MAEIPNIPGKLGQRLATTDVYNILQEYNNAVNKNDKLIELLVRLYRNTNEVRIAVNQKDTGYYDTNEFNTGITFPQTGSTLGNQRRPVFRKVVELGQLNAGVKNVAHGISIDANFKLVNVRGGADNFGANRHIPLSFVSAAGATNVSVQLTNTMVEVTNNSGVVWDSARVIIEWLKN